MLLIHCVLLIKNLSDLIESGNVVSFNWCGDEACGKAIEEETGYDILGIQEEITDSDAKCIHSGEPAKAYRPKARRAHGRDKAFCGA